MVKKFLIPFLLPIAASAARPSHKKRRVGGQAIIEGVMMRGKDSVSWAVRKNDKETVVEREEYISVCKKIRFLAKPVFRGAVSLFESLILGYRALSRSAEIIEEQERLTAEQAGKTLKKRNETGEKLTSVISLVVSFIVAVAVFLYLPMWILSHFVPKESALLFNTLAGTLRIVFMITYMVLISLWKEIRRVFEYHGAEHMAIFAYEANYPLTVENMRRYPTMHPRCGTSFLLLVGIVCILLFSVVDALYIKFMGPYPSVLVRVLVHLLLVPLVSGTSYEVLKISDKYQHLPLVGLLIKPGLWLQKITTRTPDDSQLEVAAQALTAAL